MTTAFDVGFPKEVFFAEERKITTATIEQLKYIKTIVEDRDDLKKKLESSQNILEDLVKNTSLGKPHVFASTRRLENKFAVNRALIYNPLNKENKPIVKSKSWEQETRLKKKEIKNAKDEKLTPNIEVKVIREEINVLRVYCSQLSSIQENNNQLKSRLTKYEEAIKILGFESFSETQFDNIKEKLKKLNQIVQERDHLKNQVEKLEKELCTYNDLPNHIDTFRKKTVILDEVLQDRDYLSRRVEQLNGIEDEVHDLRKKTIRLDELEEKFKALEREKRGADIDLDLMKRKCLATEAKLSNHSDECTSLRSQLVLKEQELKVMTSTCKEIDCLRTERNRLQQNLNELLHIQTEYDQMCDQVKCLDLIKMERDIYKSKYESMMGLKYECEVLHAQVQRAKSIEKERDALKVRIQEFEYCIDEQEAEIRRLICYIEAFSVARRVEFEVKYFGKDNSFQYAIFSKYAGLARILQFQSCYSIEDMKEMHIILMKHCN